MSEPQPKPGPLNRNAAEIALACAMGGEVEDELAELLQAVAARICRTVRIAREAGKYGPYSWTAEDARKQLDRAWLHLLAFKAKEFSVGCRQDTTGEGGEEDARTELEHAVTRLAILCALRDREQQKPDEAGPRNC